MTFTAFFLITSSILMHSLWHFLCKSSGKPSVAFFALFSSSLALTVMPLALLSGVVPEIPLKVWKFLLIGSAAGAICDLGLMLAYKYADISLAYPVARALPVFMTLLTTAFFGWGKPLTTVAGVGMTGIFSGCIIMAFSNSSPDKSVREKLLFLKKALPGILIAAAGTTVYTISDSFGVQAILAEFPDHNRFLTCGAYSFCRELPVTAFMWLGCGVCCLLKREQGVLRGLACSYHSYVAGISAALAYLLVLLAMNFVTNVSFVQAFRQMSLPVGALLGYIILKEKVTGMRWLGLALILLGLIMCVI